MMLEPHEALLSPVSLPVLPGLPGILQDKGEPYREVLGHVVGWK